MPLCGPDVREAVRDWFEQLTGFKERPYDETKRQLELVGERLRSTVNQRSYAIGTLEAPTLAELRRRAAEAAESLRGKLVVRAISGDARQLHRDRANANALFQVASQFNLLEMTGPEICPEDGVTRYQHDPTQGPACAIAAGAATIYRNYFVAVDDQFGQTRDRQIDCLRDIGAALGNADGRLWKMRNGYALCTDDGLALIDDKLAALDAVGFDRLRDRLHIGVHWNVEVTDAPAPRHLVTQAFCSALPISYAGPHVPSARWKRFATLVLEGAYETTLWTAVLNAHRTGSPTVFLTQVGGGAFGNDKAWIHGAMRRALDRVRGFALDVRIVSHGTLSPDLVDLASAFE